MSRRTAESQKAIREAWEKEQETGLLNSRKIFLKKAKLTMKMVKLSKVSI